MYFTNKNNTINNINTNNAPINNTTNNGTVNNTTNIINIVNYGDENLSKVYVKSGYSLLEDLNMPQDVQNTGDYANQNT